MLSKFPYTFILLNVADGDSDAAIGRLNRRYGFESSKAFDKAFLGAERNRILRYESSGFGIPLTLNARHSEYLDMLRVPAAHLAGNKGGNINVAVIDSGIDSKIQGITNYIDVTGPTPTKSPVDNDGHGTAMAMLIRTVAADCDLTVVRAANPNPLMFDLIAGIGVAVYEYQAEIVNLSVAVDGGTCYACGINSITALRYFIKGMTMLPPSNSRVPLLVSAVGNEGQSSGFREPSQSCDVLSVGSVSSLGVRSDFSNYGTIKTNYVMAPGGQDDSSGAVAEYVGAGPTGLHCYGTSVSTAYTSGLLAVLRIVSQGVVYEVAGPVG